MLEDELVVYELEKSFRVERPATDIDKVLYVVSGFVSVMCIRTGHRLTYSSVSGLGVTALRPFTSRTVIA